MKILEQSILKIFTTWLLAWLAVAGGAIYLLPETSIDQPGSFHIVSIYYLMFGFIGGHFYKVTQLDPHKVSFRTQFLQILLFSAVLIGICMAFDGGFPVEGRTFTKILHSKFYFPLFRIEILTTKFFDILFQQVFIIGLLLQLKKQQLSDQQAMIFFSAGFFLLHLPLAFSLGIQALYFILPSLFAGIVFSFLILKARNGLFFSFAVHYMFYFLIGLGLRLL